MLPYLTTTLPTNIYRLKPKCNLLELMGKKSLFLVVVSADIYDKLQNLVHNATNATLPRPIGLAPLRAGWQ